MEVAGNETDLELLGPVVEDAVVVAGERVDADEPGQPDRQLALRFEVQTTPVPRTFRGTGCVL
jgi:hypothetical protein